ncbi:MAG TPA: MT-A70 family methyltransferase [Phycisphaerae bacterium]|nr:MT-A70 family methyltransferase [Phycisphaerae bacterium]
MSNTGVRPQYANMPTTPGQYETVVVDPPWPVQKFPRRVRPNQTPALDYPTMSVEDIRAFPIDAWASPRAYLFLWTTNGFLQTAGTILGAWGFKYHATLVWCKETGVCPWSPFQFCTEFVLFGCRDGKRFREFPMGTLKTHFAAPVTRHSEKPSIFYEMLLPITPEPRIDLFARTRHPGWDYWGNELPPPGTTWN